MASLTMIFDNEGESYLDFESTIRFATQMAEDNGFETVGWSNKSEAIYLQRPDCDHRLRIAAHGGQRDQVVATALFPQERRIINGDFQTIVPLRPDDAFRIVRNAISSYDAYVAEVA